MAIPYDIVYKVERDRNIKYQWLMFVFTIGILMVHGLLFHWIPRLLRSRRGPNSLNYKWYFYFLKHWDRFSSCCSIQIGSKKYYYQPSLVFVILGFLGVAVSLTVVETTDIQYQSYGYVISKRIARIGLSNLITILVMVMKCDIVGAITGLQHDRVVFLHKWLGRFMFSTQVIHLALAVNYWLGFNFKTMLLIPPQIFGMIAMGCLTVMNLGSLKFIRNFAFDLFLVQHRIFNFIMLLFVYFHNSGTHAVTLIAVHTLVADRISGRVITFIHKRKSPTKGLAEFELLDEQTILVNYPMKVVRNDSWWTTFLPSVFWWKPGQHLYLNVWKANKFQLHPFTIASLPDSGKITLVIKVKDGFTKKLYKTLEKEQEKKPDEPLKLKASITGPMGGKRQTLIGFDTNLLIGAGVGGSMIFPLALDLLKELKRRDEIDDYLHRPKHSTVKIVWAIRHKANLSWFHQAINELIPFIKEGKLLMEVYITQEFLDSDSSSISNSSDADKGIVEYEGSSDDSYKLTEASTEIEENNKSQQAEDSNSITKCKSIEIVNTISSTESSSTASVLGELDYSSMTLEEIKAKIEKEDERLKKRRMRLREEKKKLHKIEVKEWIKDVSQLITFQYGRPCVRSLIQTEAAALNSKSTKALAVNACGPQSLLDVVKVETNQIRKIRYAPSIVCHTEGL